MGGIALITLGAIGLANASDLKGAFQENDPTFAAVLLIVFGGIVFLISFFGCCGAIRESYCMTMTYATILFVIFIAQVVLAVYVLVNQEDFKSKIVDHVGRIWANPSAPGNQETINAIQQSVSQRKSGGDRSLGVRTNILSCNYSSPAADGESAALEQSLAKPNVRFRDILMLTARKSLSTSWAMQSFWDTSRSEWPALR